MIPEVKFEIEHNPEAMIGLMNQFLIYSGKGFDWSDIIKYRYQKFGILISKINDPEEIKKISEDYFGKLFLKKTKELNIIAQDYQKEWNKIGKKILKTLSEILDIEWPKDCEIIKGWVGLNPICPRYIDVRGFDIYWKKTFDEMKNTTLHESLHFIWFEKWKQIFPDYDKKEFESPYLIWKLSEMVPYIILNDERIQKIYKHEPNVYKEWKNMIINKKPLLAQLQEIYDKKSSIEDFIKKSWEFVQKNENQINK